MGKKVNDKGDWGEANCLHVSQLVSSSDGEQISQVVLNNTAGVGSVTDLSDMGVA